MSALPVEMEIPDAVAPVVGMRVWNVMVDGTLTSYYHYNHRWPALRPLEAVCSDACICHHLNRAHSVKLAWAQLVFWAAVFVLENGVFLSHPLTYWSLLRYRAQYAYPRELFISTPHVSESQMFERAMFGGRARALSASELAARIAERYQIPVHVVPPEVLDGMA